MKKSDAVAYFGSSVKLAKAINVSKGAVSQWGEVIPLGRACQIELITKGKLKAQAQQEYKKAS